MTTIIIKRDAAHNEIRVGDTVVSLSGKGRNREARAWLQDTLFPNEPTPRALRHPQSGPDVPRDGQRNKHVAKRRRSRKRNPSKT